MAEYCLYCWNKINDTQLTTQDVIIRKDLDLCEGCGKIKYTVVCYRKNYPFVRYIKALFRIQ